MAEAPPLAPRTQRLGRHAAGFALAGLAVVGALLLAGTGLVESVNPVAGMLAAAQFMLSGGVIAAAYWAAGVGLAGPLARVLTRGSANRWWVQLGLGIGAMSWLSHLLGVAGLLSGAPGRWVAIVVVIAGLVMLLADVAAALKRRPALPAASSTVLLGLVAVAVTLCAACNPPGALWQSEARGYDAMSYHLPLAQEWVRGPRLAPLEHNVYSYLPSYYEASLQHLAAGLGGGTAAPGRFAGLLAYEGLGAISAQFLAAIAGLVAAALTGRIAAEIVRKTGMRADLAERLAPLAGGMAFAIVVATPWVVVCGSLAYNEMPMCAAFAAALLAALDERIPPGRRWLLAGVLTGLACGFKPTALFLAGPTVGLALLATTPLRTIAGPLGLGVLGGVLAFGPPLVRNAVATGGNPVFPAGATVFSQPRAGWSQEQLDRFAKAHRVDAPLGQRVAMLFSTAPDPASLDQPKQPRGVMHRQWTMVPIAGFFGATVLLIWPATRRVGRVLLLGAGAACAWWIGFSHAQSRFLLPLVVNWSVAVSVLLAMAAANAKRTRAWLVVLPLGLLPIAASATSLVLFMSQNGGMPNLKLPFGVGILSGEVAHQTLLTGTREEEERILAGASPEVYVNLAVPPEHTVYLLGSAMPFYFTGSVLYHTTWDTSPLAKPMGLFPDEPARWSAALAERGVKYILLDMDELERLTASGWYDPRVTAAKVQRLVTEQCEPVRGWTRPRVALFRLTPTPVKPADSGNST